MWNFKIHSNLSGYQLKMGMYTVTHEPHGNYKVKPIVDTQKKIRDKSKHNSKESNQRTNRKNKSGERNRKYKTGRKHF